MNNKISHYILLFMLALTIPAYTSAQNLPVLPPAKDITSGVLPNGISYYIVTNPSYKGMADVALVQKVSQSDEPKAFKGAVAVHTRASLTDLPHFTNPGPLEYLVSNSILPSAFGYADTRADATVYRFENIPLAHHPEAVDSTLLMIFDIVGLDGGGMDKAYAPSNQAIIVSGDVKASSIRGKMDMLSMLVGRRSGEVTRKAYSWKPSSMKVYAKHSWTKNSITAEYSSQRTVRGEMSSVLPLVTSRYAGDLGIILKRRLEAALSSGNVPFTSIDYSYSGSGSKSGDEIFRVTVNTGREQLEKATEILARTLAELDEEGVSADEYRDIENELALSYNSRLGRAVIENAHYVDKCTSAFLYGASLSSDKDNLNFFSNRKIDAERAAGLFNNFISALLDKSENLTLSCETITGEDTKDRIQAAFESSWAADKKVPHRSYAADSTSLRKTSGKIKLRSEAEEPLFGGKIWTFSNGMKVYYKQQDNGGYFNYSWLVKNGFSTSRELSAGESSCLSDVLGTFKVAKMTGDNFRNMLSSNGISLSSRVSFSEFNVDGIAKADKAELLMKALLSLATERSSDQAAYKRYQERERLRVKSAAAPQAKLDSIMNKGMMLSGEKCGIVPDDDFQDKAMNYFDDVFSKAGDGVLIIVGDIQEGQLKKILLKYLGAFQSGKSYSPRIRSTETSISNRNTVYSLGKKPLAGIEMKASFNYTAGNFMSANIAAIAEKEALAGAAAKTGWYVDFSSADISLFPQECLTFGIVARRAAASGLPASMVPADSSEAMLETMRLAASQLGRKGIDENSLLAYKQMLSNYYASWITDPVAITRMLELRYSYGKDLVTDYGQKIASVKKEDVDRILASLPKGGVAEYAVQDVLPPDFQEDKPKDGYRLNIEHVAPYKSPLSYPFDGEKLQVDTTVDTKALDALVLRHLARVKAEEEAKAAEEVKAEEEESEVEEIMEEGNTAGEGEVNCHSEQSEESYSMTEDSSVATLSQNDRENSQNIQS